MIKVLKTKINVAKVTEQLKKIPSRLGPSEASEGFPIFS
jgi:hypothetical protein